MKQHKSFFKRGMGGTALLIFLGLLTVGLAGVAIFSDKGDKEEETEVLEDDLTRKDMENPEMKESIFSFLKDGEETTEEKAGEEEKVEKTAKAKTVPSTQVSPSSSQPPKVAPAQTKTLSEVEVAKRILTHNQKKEFIALYNFLCSAEKNKISVIDYTSYLADYWGNVSVVSFDVQAANSTQNGARVLYGETYSNGDGGARELILGIEEGNWCFYSGIADTIADIAYFKNIKSILVDSTYPLDPPDIPIKPQNDGAIVRVTISNEGNKTFLCHDQASGALTKCGQSSFRLKDKQGNIYPVIGGTLTDFSLTSLNNISGTLIFEVPHNSSGYVLEFYDLGLNSSLVRKGTLIGVTLLDF